MTETPSERQLTIEAMSESMKVTKDPDFEAAYCARMVAEDPRFPGWYLASVAMVDELLERHNVDREGRAAQFIFDFLSEEAEKYDGNNPAVERFRQIVEENPETHLRD
jgi:hypothetical protein